jgi:hypothetical protein
MEITFNQGVTMELTAQSIDNNVRLAKMIVNLEIIIFDHVKPSYLMHVQLRLGEDIFDAFMVCIDIAHITQQVMSLDLQSMNNDSEF